MYEINELFHHLILSKFVVMAKRELTIKRMTQAFSRAYERKLKVAERRNFRTANTIYLEGFEKATELLLTTENLRQVELIPAETLFNISLFDDLFNKIYVETGLDFALWYQRNFERFTKKGEGFTDIWQNAFTVQGARSAGLRVTSIQGTAKKAFVSNIQKLFQDPKFAGLGIEAKARILRKAGYWNKEARFLARRVARTESNSAANYALTVSAESMFPTTRLLKRWITAGDERVRPTHMSAQGQTVPKDAFFNVGGVQLKYPADMNTAVGAPKSVASEVINCRCRVEVFPDPEAVEAEIGGFQSDLLFQIAVAGLLSSEEELI